MEEGGEEGDCEGEEGEALDAEEGWGGGGHLGEVGGVEGGLGSGQSGLATVVELLEFAGASSGLDWVERARYLWKNGLLMGFGTSLESSEEK